LPFAQNSEELAQTAGHLVYEIQPGESETLQWGLNNMNEDESITVTLEAFGDGSELVTLPEIIELPPDQWVWVDITVTIPEDHPNDVYVGPRISAFQAAPETESVLRIAFQVEKTT